jgi:hypothetical protein
VELRILIRVYGVLTWAGLKTGLSGECVQSINGPKVERKEKKVMKSNGIFRHLASTTSAPRCRPDPKSDRCAAQERSPSPLLPSEQLFRPSPLFTLQLRLASLPATSAHTELLAREKPFLVPFNRRRRLACSSPRPRSPCCWTR